MVELPFHDLRPTFHRTLWTVKVNFIVKKLGAAALTYHYSQEIHPRSQFFLRMLPSTMPFNYFQPFSRHEKEAHFFVELC
jgi:hypothetical protein